ncbi:MAG TPA: hypothetical protein VGR14_19940 [Verrucomicrobiae bacterium]|jgi:hypothetical protein|nr:hypothetical protein [Verrucomicrobiae bacterium]
MSAAESKPNEGGITPAVHLEFIQNQLENPGASAVAVGEIEQYHRALFLHHHAVEWEHARQKAHTHAERLAFLEGRLKETELRLTERPGLVPVLVDGREDTAPNPPWNAWEMFMFAICCLGIVCLIAFGVSNISFNLLESGFITFRENPLRAYLWSALLPVGALAIKVGWDCLPERRTRDRYLWFCLGMGVLGVLVWVAAYASVYPSLSKGINDQIASLTVFDSPSTSGAAPRGLNFAGAKWIDVITVAGQAVAEIFLSAVLGMYLTTLYARHRPVRLALDPATAQLARERSKLEENIARERHGLGEANGSIVKLENQLAALLAYGKSMFHRESARRQDQTQKRQIILEQLSDHVRNHLDTAQPGNNLAGAAAVSSSYRSNGG